MGAQIGANPLQVLQRVPDDGSILLQNCNELPSLTLCQLTLMRLAYSIVVEEGILQPRRQRFYLKKKMLRFLFFVELEVAAQIYFLGEVNGTFF